METLVSRKVLLVQGYLKLRAQASTGGLGSDSDCNRAVTGLIDRTEFALFPLNDPGGYMHVYAPKRSQRGLSTFYCTQYSNNASIEPNDLYKLGELAPSHI